MKLFKKISAAIIATTMFGASVMAAGVFTLSDEVSIASDATQVSFEVTADAGTTVGAFSSFTITYDVEKFVYNETDSSCGYGNVGNVDTDSGLVQWTTESLVSVTEDEDTVIKCVFDIKPDAEVEDATFEIIDFLMFADDNMTQMIDEPSNMDIKVVVEKAQDPVPGTVGTKDGYTTVVDSDKATRFVVTDTKASIAATAASVLKVTYDGDSKSANLYNLLGVDPEATGDVTIGSLTIKMVLPAGVQDAADIADYSFIVE